MISFPVPEYSVYGGNVCTWPGFMCWLPWVFQECGDNDRKEILKKKKSWNSSFLLIMTFWQGKSSWFVVTSFLSTPSPPSCCTGYKLLFCTALGAPSQHLLPQPRRGSAPLPTPYFCACYLENVSFFQLIIWHLKKYVLKGPVREGHNRLEISSFLQKQNEMMILNITKSLECREL